MGLLESAFFWCHHWQMYFMLFEQNGTALKRNWRTTTLPVFSKIFPDLLKERRIKYFQSKELWIHRKQIHHLVKVKNYITEAIDGKKCTALSTLDLSKTLDLVDHQIILEKLQFYKWKYYDRSEQIASKVEYHIIHNVLFWGPFCSIYLWLISVCYRKGFKRHTFVIFEAPKILMTDNGTVLNS